MDKNIISISKEDYQNQSGPHKDVIDILFFYKNEIYHKFCDLKGLYFLDHISLILMDPDNKFLIFSSTPSVEYNLLVNDLWKHDLSFNPRIFVNNSLLWWDQNESEYYPEIKKIKEIEHNFTIGFNLYKSIDNFKFIYCFASRNKNLHLRQYYIDNKDKIFLLGNFCYKLINNIYQKYCTDYKIPAIESNIHPVRSHLKLIINRNIK